jgi:hypothetical protein
MKQRSAQRDAGNRSATAITLCCKVASKDYHSVIICLHATAKRVFKPSTCHIGAAKDFTPRPNMALNLEIILW